MKKSIDGRIGGKEVSEVDRGAEVKCDVRHAETNDERSAVGSVPRGEVKKIL